ncbi:hypothetical protein IFR05_013518, partial [Cadophora sp. M221]
MSEPESDEHWRTSSGATFDSMQPLFDSNLLSCFVSNFKADTGLLSATTTAPHRKKQSKVKADTTEHKLMHNNL